MAWQLSFEERERLSQLHEEGESVRAIAREFGRAASTISRELRRNSDVRHYSAVVALGKCLERQRQRPLVRKLERPAILDAVRSGLARRWSPDQIAGRLQQMFPRDRAQRVSHQTIYTWLAALPCSERRRFRAFLRRGGLRRPPIGVFRGRHPRRSLRAAYLPHHPPPIGGTESPNGSRHEHGSATTSACGPDAGGGGVALGRNAIVAEQGRTGRSAYRYDSTPHALSRFRNDAA